MSQSSLSIFTSMLLHYVPALLVYAVAFVLALTFMRRAPLSSALVLAGVGVMATTAIAVVVAQTYLIGAHQSGSFESIRSMMTVVSIAGSCAHGLGMALLVAAAFVGRRPREVRPAPAAHGPGV